MPAIAQRPLAIRKRPDLVAQAQVIGEKRVWRVKDPVSLEYFEFSEQEYAILDMLDGRTTLVQIQRRFEQAFAPLQLRFEQLQSFLASLHQSGLVLATAAGQGAILLDRRRAQGSREWLSQLLNVLAFRVRGINPQPMLDWLYPKLSWIFSGAFLAACAMLTLAAALLVAVQFDVFQSRLPALHEFLTPDSVIWLAGALIGAKIVHELAHALTCRHFGGKCHEMGLMFLVFTPCLFCNVSDAWMLADRRARVMISSAGVLAELVLAGCATFLWWFSQPGLFNSICLDVMLVCSISTLVFNANPLLRYDGYYVLADLLNESNLAQKSSELIRTAVGEWFRGIPLADQAWRTAQRPLRLAIYGVLSGAYRVFVLALILWFCHTFFTGLELPSIGRAVMFIALAGAFFGPAAAALSFLRDPLKRRQLDGGRLKRLAFVLGLVLLAAFLIPIPRRVTADLVLEAPAAPRVYVPVAGRLEHMVASGTAVHSGDVLARLSDPRLRREVEKTLGERNQAEKHLAQLEVRRAEDPEAAAQIPAAREALEGLARRLKQQESDEARLVLKSPADGVVLPPPSRITRDVKRPDLPSWQRTPLDDFNIGCWLETGTLLCQVGDPPRVEPVLLVHQSDIDLVKPGQRVRLRVDEWPGSVLSGTITETAAANLEIVSREPAAPRGLPVRVDASGTARPVEAVYQARVALDDHGLRLLLRGRGQARVATEPAPLAQRLYRALRQTFRFGL